MHTNYITLHDERHVSSGNSVEVAKGAHHRRWATNIIEIGRPWHQNTFYIHAHEHYTLHDKTHVSSGNSEGVAIPQPRVAGEARYPG